MKFTAVHIDQQIYIDTHNFIYLEEDVYGMNYICTECGTLAISYYEGTKFALTVRNLVCAEIIIKSVLE